MSLQLILGGAGTGKSHYAYEWIIREAAAHPDVLYYVVVPEQFTLQIQKTVVESTPGKGILNIDVVSFLRLSYRVFEETGGDNLAVLDDLGKSMILRKIAQEQEENLVYLRGQMKKPGYLDEVKSLFSEFLQYEVSEEELMHAAQKAGESSLLGRKLTDLTLLYREFRAFLEGHYLTSEEVLSVLADRLPASRRLRNAVVLFDGFTGFTPVQLGVVRQLLAICSRVLVAVTMDGNESIRGSQRSYPLFSMSQKMIQSLLRLTPDTEEPVRLFHHENSRFASAPALRFLEEQVFRYRHQSYPGEQKSVRMYEAADPREEMAYCVRRIHQLVREDGLTYGEIAIISGNLEEYGRIASDTLQEAGLPFFLDEPHNVKQNPMVEFLCAALDVVRRDFSYERVFRYLRCGLSSVSQEEADLLENYVLAMGIRGRRLWSSPFSYIHRGMEGEELLLLNRIREKLMEELTPLLDGFSQEKETMEAYCAALYHFLREANVYEKLQERAESFRQRQEWALEKENLQIYDQIMKLLERMVDVLEEERLTREEFVQLLETGLSKVKIALIPPGQDQILIGDMQRTRLRDIRALFFVGVNEGNIPRTPSTGGLLTVADREILQQEELALAPDPREELSIQRFYLYLNLTRPTEYLTLSYALTSTGGEAKKPAYLIHSLAEMFPDAMEQEEGLDRVQTPEDGLHELVRGLRALRQAGRLPGVEEETAWTQTVLPMLYRYYRQDTDYLERLAQLEDAVFYRQPKDEISRAVARVLYGDVSRMGATSLERYAACAFAHFLSQGLRLTERQLHAYQAPDLGNLLHGALELFARKVKEKHLTWDGLSEEVRTSLAEESLQEMLAQESQRILKEDARKAYTVERARRLLQRTVWALQQQLRNGEFQPEGFEVSLGGNRIDRMDVLTQEGRVYVKVIDYKTGGTSFDLLSLYYGKQLQLALYMDSAIHLEETRNPGKEVIPAGVFYYNIKDPMVAGTFDTSESEVSQALLKELKMNGLVLKDAEVALKMDRTLQSIPVALKKDGEFSSRGTSAASRENLEILHRYVRRTMEQMRARIASGDIAMEPSRVKGEARVTCDFCVFSSACGFDRKLPECRVRELPKLAEDEIFERMRMALAKETVSNKEG